MGFLIFVIVVTLAILLIIYFGLKGELEQNKKEISNAINNAIIPDPEFKETQSFISADYISKIAIDEVSKKFAFWLAYDDTPTTVKAIVSVYNYSDILSVEILENGITTSQTSRKSQIGGALIGGVIAGGAGAIIGGLSGTTSSINEIESVELKVVVNDMSDPVFMLNMIHKVHDNENRPITKGSAHYNSLMKNVYHWHSILGYTIKKLDEIDDVQENHINSPSLSTKLKELNELKVEGILTEEEFNQQKVKILNA